MKITKIIIAAARIVLILITCWVMFKHVPYNKIFLRVYSQLHFSEGMLRLRELRRFLWSHTAVSDRGSNPSPGLLVFKVCIGKLKQRGKRLWVCWSFLFVFGSTGAMARTCPLVEAPRFQSAPFVFIAHRITDPKVKSLFRVSHSHVLMST